MRLDDFGQGILVRRFVRHLTRLWRRTKRFSWSRRIMRLSSIFIRDQLNDEQNNALKCLAQSRPDVLYVCSIKTAILNRHFAFIGHELAS